MKVILAGGGTGGHLYPGIAVAERLKEAGINTLFLVSGRGIEKKVLDKLGYEYLEQNVSGFSGVSIPRKIKAVWELYKTAGLVSSHIEKGDKILLLGGFAAAPAALAGVRKKAELYIHEQNSVTGLVNRLAARYAEGVLLSYDDTGGLNKSANLHTVGNPVRRELLYGEVKKGVGKNLLILGGSQGSRIINRTVAAAAPALINEGYIIRHQTGERLFEETGEFYKNAGVNPEKLELAPYITDMKNAYEWADIIVARSGSGSVHEITYARRPAIYIPFAGAANNHQYFNALAAAKRGYCSILEEKDLSPANLEKEVRRIYKDIDSCKTALQGVKVVDSVGLIIKYMGLEVPLLEI